MDFKDSLKNFMSGLGITGRDKTKGGQFEYGTELSAREATALYADHWPARKAIKIRINDMMKRGRTITGFDAEQQLKYQAAWKELKLESAIKAQLRGALMKGGSVGFVILNGDDETQMDELEFSTIGAGDVLKYVVMDCDRIETGTSGYDLETNMLSDYFGEPRKFGIRKKDQTTKDYHRTRLVIAYGSDSRPSEAEWCWPDSYLKSARRPIEGYETAMTGATIAMMEYGAKTLKIPGLMESIRDCNDMNDPMVARIMMIGYLRSALNVTVLDAKEELVIDHKALAGLEGAFKVYQADIAGAFDIPHNRMFGMAASGLGDKGGSQNENYEDSISGQQEDILRPLLDQLDRFMLRHVFGDKPPEIEYVFNPLRTPDRKALADLKKADIDADILALEFLDDENAIDAVTDEWVTKGYIPKEAKGAQESS